MCKIYGLSIQGWLYLYELAGGHISVRLNSCLQTSGMLSKSLAGAPSADDHFDSPGICPVCRRLAVSTATHTYIHIYVYMYIVHGTPHVVQVPSRQHAL